MCKYNGILIKFDQHLPVQLCVLLSLKVLAGNKPQYLSHMFLIFMKSSAYVNIGVPSLLLIFVGVHVREPVTQCENVHTTWGSITNKGPFINYTTQLDDIV